MQQWSNFLIFLPLSPNYKLLSTKLSHGPVAQLVMRRIRIAEIRGSTPLRSTLRPAFSGALCGTATRECVPQSLSDVGQPPILT